MIIISINIIVLLKFDTFITCHRYKLEIFDKQTFFDIAKYACLISLSFAVRDTPSTS